MTDTKSHSVTGPNDATETEERNRAFEHDATPAPLVRQLLQHCYPEGAPLHFLDPAAGHGVFGMEVAKKWPACRRYAFEPREEAFEDLHHHHHVALMHTLAQALPLLHKRDHSFSLIATNPPFSHALDFLELLHPRLSNDGWLWLLQLTDWGQRSQKSIKVFQKLAPAVCLRIGAPIQFRGVGTINPKNKKPYGSDMRSYSWWGWKKEPVNFTTLYTLPALPTDDRRWVVTPGTEWRNE